jgi:phosphate/sulfate permease
LILSITDTLRDGILKPEQYENDPAELAVGMTAAMIGAWFLVTVATWFHLPVSATHAVSKSDFKNRLPAKKARKIK